MRRLTVYLRRGLFGVGVVLLLWWLVSFRMVVSWDWQPAAIEVGNGAFYWAFWWSPQDWSLTGDASFILGRSSGMPISFTPAWGEGGLGGKIYYVYVPLYLLAAACLAWPVTSFFLARRRKGRGFAVEPTPELQGGRR